MRNLNIAPRGLGEMLANGEFVVPTYQRSFAWSGVNVQDLLTDLSGAMKKAREGKGGTYFLGTIVVIERPKSKPFEVVDGQQRLATISIFLAAVRDYHIAMQKDAAASTYDLYVRGLHVPTGQYRARLRLNEVDDRCYAKMIVAPPSERTEEKWPRKSHKLILAAYQKATGFIESLAQTHTPKNTIEVLYQMTEFIKNNTQVIRVIVDDEADAYTIFETMNDRHVYLTVSDLLKNFLFGLAGESIETAKSNWRGMQAVLDTLKSKKDRTVDFIRQLWGSMHGLFREKELVRDIKNKITGEKEAIELSAMLANQAADYVAVLNPLDEMWDGYGPETRHALETFHALRVERLRPLLLAILNRFEKDEVIKAMSFLRCAAVRIIVNTGINGTIEEEIYEIAVKVHKRDIKNASQLKKAMPFVPNNEVFKAIFATMNVSKRALARFYLQEIQDAAYEGDSVTNRNEKKVDLEHVIPDSAEERAAHWPELTPELGASLCHRFGNLTLLNKKRNQSLNGRKFAEKAQIYAQCEHIPLTLAIARDYQEFGEDEVNHRQSRLAELAVETWPLTSRKQKR
jgi:hypothetical protein